MKKKTMMNERYPELDGIRGIAILLVMMTHFIVFEPWSVVDNLATKFAGGGWIGVDLFFVLSGFLITGILFDTRHSLRYLSTFYLRRTLRIFPLYFAFVLGLFVVCYLIVPDWPQAARWRDAQAWYWTYTVNFLVTRGGSWAATPLHTGHLWSLAIEEQFYLIWPFVVWRLSRRQLMTVCAVVFASSLLLRFALRVGGFDPIALFVATPTRLDPLMAGAFTAMLLRGPTPSDSLKRLGAWAVAIGAILTAAAVVAQFSTHQYGFVMQTVGYSGIAIAAAGIVLAARSANPAWFVRRLLRAPVLVFFGMYSYALYMLHGLAMVATGALFPPLDRLPALQGVMLHWVLLRGLVATALAVGAALVSWHVLEKRFLAMKRKHREGDEAPAMRPAIAK